MYPHTVDNKGRIILPARIRDGLGGDRLIITNGFEKCLYAYAPGEWEKIEEAISALPTTSEKVRMFERFFVGPAEWCEIDGQGRILIPLALREYAKLDKQVCVVGLKRRLEIWDKGAWDRHMEETAPDPMQAAEEMANLGLKF